MWWRRKRLSPIVGCFQPGTFREWVEIHQTSKNTDLMIILLIIGVQRHLQWRWPVQEWHSHRLQFVLPGFKFSSFYPLASSQWVPLYLIFNALLFYCPRLCWLSIEGGLMQFFSKGTTTRSLFKKSDLIYFPRFIEYQDEKKDRLVAFFRNNISKK